MKIEQFLTDNQPKSKRSILYKYTDDILLLRSKDYSLEQIRDYLAKNGITISISMISRFIKKEQNNIVNIPTVTISNQTNEIQTDLKNTTISNNRNPLSVLNAEKSTNQFKFSPHKK